MPYSPTSNSSNEGTNLTPPDISSLLATLHGTVTQAGSPLVPPPPPPPVVVHPMAAQTTSADTGGSWGGTQGSGDVKAQLKAGFQQAGRQDLADMVDTPEFSTWVNQESGWNPNSISPANNQGKPNYGLFQFWAGHDFARPDMSPTEQAFLAATKFQLSPDKIRGFASQIHAGSYKGWG